MRPQCRALVRQRYAIKYRYQFLLRVETPMSIQLQSVARMRAQLNQFAGRKQVITRRHEQKGVGSSLVLPLVNFSTSFVYNLFRCFRPLPLQSWWASTLIAGKWRMILAHRRVTAQWGGRWQAVQVTDEQSGSSSAMWLHACGYMGTCISTSILYECMVVTIVRRRRQLGCHVSCDDTTPCGCLTV